VEHAPVLEQHELIHGRYRPLRPLGSGGSGSVWLVRDEQRACDVALKVIPREGKAGSRAEREVEAAARLRHPRCLPALALHRDERHVYVSYEYVRGRTLHEAMRAGELDDATAIEAAAQVLDALAHAHAHGIVHRDVKPSNIMLEESEQVRVRVLDFGLASVREADTLTAAGDVPGTLSYIAPERLSGQEAAGAADVWAVGVLLWEALTGRHPFWASSPLETARRVKEGARPLASARPDLPTELCAALDRMLSLVPARRPAAKQAAALLRAACARQGERRRAKTSRSTLLERAGPAALAAVFAGGTVWLLPFFPSGWPFLLGGLAALVTLSKPSAGLALALAAPVLPLGNLSLGLAVAYTVLAGAWLALFARDAGSGLLFLVGPLLAPLGALGLAPLLVERAAGVVRRAALGAGTVAATVAVAALTGSQLPLTGAPLPRGEPLAGEEAPTRAADAILDLFAADGVLALETLVFAAAAASIGLARRHGLWGAAFWGSGFLTAALLVPLGAVAALPLAAAVWAATGILAASLLKDAH
jgi:predicted Ser/Thr protein kinase